jgi:hypothetical protein
MEQILHASNLKLSEESFSWADLFLHFCGVPLQTTGINQPFLCARLLSSRGIFAG